MESCIEQAEVFVVRRAVRWSNQAVESWEIVSAWADEYHAKHEAMRWEQDSKRPHDYVRGKLIVVG